jgi:Helix-turn-helix domain
MQAMQHIEIEAEALLDAKEVKRLLRCSLPFIYKLAERKQLSCIRIACPGLGTWKRELVRFKREDVISFIEQHYKKV